MPEETPSALPSDNMVNMLVLFSPQHDPDIENAPGVRYWVRSIGEHVPQPGGLVIPPRATKLLIMHNVEHSVENFAKIEEYRRLYSLTSRDVIDLRPAVPAWYSEPQVGMRVRHSTNQDEYVVSLISLTSGTSLYQLTNTTTGRPWTDASDQLNASIFQGGNTADGPEHWQLIADSPN